MNYDELKAPFAPDDVEWRAGATNSDKSRALALAYITSRAVMDRLDDICGPGNWKDEYRPAPSGGVLCGISILADDDWITKWDGAENTEFESVKGGLSGAFKRAAVKWGIGRYLYNLPDQWVACERRGKSVVLTETPHLPNWALPEKFQGNRPGAKKPTKKPTKKPQPQADGPEPERPYPPEYTKKRLRDLTAYATSKGKAPTDMQRKYIAPNLEQLFPNGRREESRRAVTDYVFGVTSTKDLSPPEMYALVQWMARTEDPDTGDWIPDLMSVHEAEAIREAYESGE